MADVDVILHVVISPTSEIGIFSSFCDSVHGRMLLDLILVKISSHTIRCQAIISMNGHQTLGYHISYGHNMLTPKNWKFSSKYFFYTKLVQVKQRFIYLFIYLCVYLFIIYLFILLIHVFIVYLFIHSLIYYLFQ